MILLKNMKLLFCFALISGFSLSAFSQNYVNDMDFVLGDAKQAFIKNRINTRKKADMLLKGFKTLQVNGIRIPIFAEGLNPNKEMFDYFYSQAVAQGFLIYANPAQGGGGARIANGTLNGPVTSVKNKPSATNKLINRIKDFSREYKCKWVNAFNEDGRATNSTWSVNQINTVYSTLFRNVNGAELIGPCTWGLPAGIDMLRNTKVRDYITVAATHNLGFNHGQWPTYIALAKEKRLPVWDSEVNHFDKFGTGTRLVKAIQNKVDGLVLYDSWKTINLNNGSVSAGGRSMRDLYLESTLSTGDNKNIEVAIYPNPTSDKLTVDTPNAKFNGYTIYTINGQVVSTNEIKTDSNKIDINLSEFSKAIYFLKLEGDAFSGTYKIVKD